MKSIREWRSRFRNKNYCHEFDQISSNYYNKCSSNYDKLQAHKCYTNLLRNCHNLKILTKKIIKFKTTRDTLLAINKKVCKHARFNFVTTKKLFDFGKEFSVEHKAHKSNKNFKPKKLHKTTKNTKVKLKRNLYKNMC